MYLLIFASVTMVTMSCNAALSRQYKNMVMVNTASKVINLPEDIIAYAHEADFHYTHISSENLDMNHEVDKMTMTDVNVVSSNLGEECDMCVSESATTGKFKTQDKTSVSTSSFVYVSDMVERDDKIDLSVKHGEKTNIAETLSGNNSTKNTSPKTTVNFEKSATPIQSQELFTTQERIKNLSTKLSIEGTEKSVISTESNVQNADINTSLRYKFVDPSEQYLNRPQNPLSFKTDNNANETEYYHQDNEHGLSHALKKKPAESYKETAVENCDPGPDLTTYHSETVKLRGSIIRPAMLQQTSRTYEPILEFPDVPEGGKFHIKELDLSEGVFVFGYISSFLSWIQPYEFPVELLRDALWNGVSVGEFIIQSLQVEAAFIVCLTVGVLLALGAPCILGTHACYRMLNSRRDTGRTEDSSDDTANCRRCSLTLAMQLTSVLLVVGIVSMFVTNEQLTRAVDLTPNVVHTAFNDVTTFLHNSHQQLRFVITKSLDHSVAVINNDLDNVEELLGRPIQEELAMETGTDVALDALIDVSTEAIVMSGRVEALLTSCAETLELVAETRERLADLNLQVDVFRLQCPSRYRPLCDTVDTGGLDVTLRLDALVSDDRLAKIKGLGDGNLSLETQQARGQFHFIPQRVEKETRNARNGVKRQLTRQKEVLYDSIWSLDVITRDIAYKSEDARNKVLQIAKEISTIDQWRWFIGFGSAMSVTLVWLLLVYGISCGCCGSQKRATHILLASVVLMCIFSVALWGVALGALFVGGHGEVFVCRPLYDEPEFSTLTRLVDQPSALFQKGGGFFSNLLYGNSTMDVPIRDVLQKCKKNESAYSTFRLKQVFDMDAATNHKRWDLMHAELERLHVNLTNLQLLTPGLQYQLQALLHATTVNLTNHRTQMSGQVTGKDLSSFADQMTSVANQITDMSTLSRLDTLASTTRQLVISHIQPLERHKVDLVYQLTALEMQMVPLQRQVNQSLSHLKTIQYFINNQGSNIAYEKFQDYRRRLVSYVDQYRTHVLNMTQLNVASCQPVWNLYQAARLFFCRHIMDPLNGFWFATVWCLLLFLAATSPCLKLIDHYRHLRQNNISESPSETLMISEQGTSWTTPGDPEPDGW